MKRHCGINGVTGRASLYDQSLNTTDDVSFNTVAYDNTTSGLAATDVQAAIDEVSAASAFDQSLNTTDDVEFKSVDAASYQQGGKTVISLVEDVATNTIADNAGGSVLGSESTIVGYSACNTLGVGIRNTAYGSLSGYNGAATSSRNTLIGASAGAGINGTLNTAVGQNANNQTVTADKTLALGADSRVLGDNSMAIGAEVHALVTNTCVIGKGITELTTMNDNECDLGASGTRWKDLHVAGAATVGGATDSLSYKQDGVDGKLIETIATNAYVANGKDTSLATYNNSVIVGPGCGGAGNYNSVVVGVDAGNAVNVVDSRNTIVGFWAGQTPTTGNYNVLLGGLADVTSATVSSAVAIGEQAKVTNTGGVCVGRNSQAATGIALGTNVTAAGSEFVHFAGTNLMSATDATTDLGSATNQYKDLYLSGHATIGGITFPKPWFEAYAEDNATVATTSSASTSTFVKCDFPTSPTTGYVQANAGNQSFTVDGTTNRGRITYTGTMTRYFHCGVTLSVYPGSNSNHEWQFALFKNGTLVTGSKVEITTTSSGDRYSTAIHSIPQLATNDYIELWCLNQSVGSQTITIHEMNFFGMALPNSV